MKQYYIRPIPLVSHGQRDMSAFTYRMNLGIPCLVGFYVWYIEGSEPRTLVDAGCTVDTYQKRGVHQGERHVQTLEEGLSRLGLAPTDIGQVIITHLHFDHMALASKFTKAKFIVQKTELSFAMNPHPFMASTYDMTFYRSIDFKVVQGDTEILEGVKVLYTPGHSPGNQSVCVETPGGRAIIAGFCSIKENFDPPPAAGKKGWFVAPPASHTDALQAFDSILKVKKNVDIVIPNHDMRHLKVQRIPDL